MDMEWYSSIAGIAAAAVACGAATRQWLGDVEGANAVPLVVYVMAYAGLGTFIAYAVMETITGNPWQLLVQAVTAGIIAVGAVSAASNITKPLSQTVHKR